MQADYGRRKKGEKWDYMEGGQNNRGGGGEETTHNPSLPHPVISSIKCALNQPVFTGSVVFRPEFRGYENRKCHWVVWRGSIPLTCGKHHQTHCTFFISGDILGFLIDLEEGKVMFSLNGNEIEKDFKAARSG